MNFHKSNVDKLKPKNFTIIILITWFFANKTWIFSHIVYMIYYENCNYESSHDNSLAFNPFFFHTIPIHTIGWGAIVLLIATYIVNNFIYVGLIWYGWRQRNIIRYTRTMYGNVGKKGTVQMNRVFLKSLEGEIENSRKRETAVLHFTLSLWFSCVYFVSNYNIQYDNN